MKRLIKLFVILLYIALYSCSNAVLPSYVTLEDKVYDIPFKSQTSLSIVLNDSTIPKQQVVNLIESLSVTQMNRSMKYHSTPTHVFIYIYNNKAEFDKGMGGWIAMFQKVGEDDPGHYSYKEKSLD